MKVALHLDSEPYGGYYGPPIEELVLRTLAKLPSDRRHLRLYCGDLLSLSHANTLEDLERITQRILETPGWLTVERGAFLEAAQTTTIFVIVVEGLPRSAALEVDRTLQSEPCSWG